MNNNRKHQRYFFDSAIEFETEHGVHVGRAVNISQGGMLIKSDLALSFGSKVTVYLSLPRIKDVCQIPCIVRWSGEENLAGLQFEHLRAKEVWGLNQLMHTLEPSE